MTPERRVVFFQMVEAGGFEPPSRDISGQASTCLVVFLSFAPAGAKRQAPAFASSLKSRYPAANMPSSQPAARRPERTCGQGPPGRAALFTQPLHTGSCQLLVAADDLAGQPLSCTCSPTFYLSGRSRSPPIHLSKSTCFYGSTIRRDRQRKKPDHLSANTLITIKPVGCSACFSPQKPCRNINPGCSAANRPSASRRPARGWGVSEGSACPGSVHRMCDRRDNRSRCHAIRSYGPAP